MLGVALGSLLVGGCSFLERASQTSARAAAAAAAAATNVDITPDGRFVAFTTAAAVIAADTNAVSDAYVLDRTTGIFDRVSVSTAEAQQTAATTDVSIADDGNRVAMQSDASFGAADANAGSDVFVRDRAAGTTALVSAVLGAPTETGNDASTHPRISANGLVVVFDSQAGDLVAGIGGVDHAYVYARTLAAATTALASLRDDDTIPLDGSRGSVSADGRYVAFDSGDAAITVGDDNEVADVFVRDRVLGTTVRVSDVAVEIEDGASTDSAISDDGRYVAFRSDATVLVADDGNDETDVFVFDRTTSIIERASVATDGSEVDDSIAVFGFAPDGRSVAFLTGNAFALEDTDTQPDLYRRDLDAAATLLASSPTAAPGAGAAIGVSTAVSTGGTTVAFATDSGVFVGSPDTGTVERPTIGTAPASSDSPSLSADGRIVAFSSTASNLAGPDTNDTRDVFVRDNLTRSLELVSTSSTGVQGDAPSASPAVSDDGRYVAFVSRASTLVPGDDNARADVFVKDRTTGELDWVSVGMGGLAGTNDSGYVPQLDRFLPVAISGDGRYVSFMSRAPNLIVGDSNTAADVFVRDRLTDTTERVSVAAGGGQLASSSTEQVDISDDGRYAIFVTASGSVVPGDTNAAYDVFRRDRVAATTVRVSLRDNDLQTSTGAASASMSADGSIVAFTSSGSDLVVGDDNGTLDVFVRVVGAGTAGTTTIASVNEAGAEGDDSSFAPVISDNGRFVAFTTRATNIVATTFPAHQLAVRDRTAGTTRIVSAKALGVPSSGLPAAGFAAALSGSGRYAAFAHTDDLDDRDPGANLDVYVRATTVPEVVGVAPSVAPRGTTTTVTLTGRNFVAPLTVAPLEAGTTIGTVVVVNENTATVQVVVAGGAAIGPRSFLVSTPGWDQYTGAVNVCLACVTVS